MMVMVLCVEEKTICRLCWHHGNKICSDKNRRNKKYILQLDVLYWYKQKFKFWGYITIVDINNWHERKTFAISFVLYRFKNNCWHEQLAWKKDLQKPHTWFFCYVCFKVFMRFILVIVKGWLFLSIIIYCQDVISATWRLKFWLAPQVKKILRFRHLSSSRIIPL